MKKYIISYKRTIALFVVALSTLPSILNAQNFTDAVFDSVVVTPVNLTRFTAEKNEKNVQLNWTTATEKSNSHFNIQRSLDEINFENIAKVITKGNSSNIQNYTYLDANVPDISLYYRLQQVDVDGKATLSSIVLVKYTKISNAELSIYPNPITNHSAIITLKNAPIGKYNVVVKTLIGETIFISAINTSGNSAILLPASVSKGLYIVNVISVNGKTSLTQKIIIE